MTPNRRSLSAVRASSRAPPAFSGITVVVVTIGDSWDITWLASARVLGLLYHRAVYRGNIFPTEREPLNYRDVCCVSGSCVADRFVLLRYAGGYPWRKQHDQHFVRKCRCRFTGN